MRSSVLRLCALWVCVAIVGCTTVQPLAVDASDLSRNLKPGDQVEVVTARGQHLQFRIDAIDGEGLSGAGQRLAYTDIQSISRKQISGQRTALAVLGVVAAGALAAGGGGGGGY
jgi:hypothetical protein